MSIDIAANRSSRKYSRWELLARLVWGLVWPLFRFSPRIAFGWRRFLLRLFGARIGKQVHIYNSVRIVMPWNLEMGDWSCIGEESLIYNLGQVVIGEKATLSHRVHLCAGTHDYAKPDLPLLKSTITVGSQAWICTESLIGPGVMIGEGAVTGAGSVVMKDVPAWAVVAGNPAQFVKTRNIEEGMCNGD